VLGFAPIAAAPLGATGESGASFDVSFGAAAVITDAAASLPVYASSVAEATLSDMSVAVAASAFNAIVSFEVTGVDASAAVAVFTPSISESAVGDDAASALAIFSSTATDSGLAADSVLVEASVFNATAADAADAADAVRSSAVMVGSVSEDADIDDSNSASYLWNIINNAQSVNWTVVKTQN
jgi:hypothetical protein